MSTLPSDFEHEADDLATIINLLENLGADRAVLKMLPKNANEKNQVYIASNYSSLHSNFKLTISERGESTSLTKDKSNAGTKIPEASSA